MPSINIVASGVAITIAWLVANDLMSYLGLAHSPEVL